MQTAIRKIGHSKGAIIPAQLLKELRLDVNDKVDVKAEGGRLVIEPISESPEYDLSELLKQSEGIDMSLSDADKSWLNKDCGKEI